MRNKIIFVVVLMLLSASFVKAQGTVFKDSTAYFCGVCGGSCDTLTFFWR
jgi:hypothetical protein